MGSPRLNALFEEHFAYRGRRSKMQSMSYEYLINDHKVVEKCVAHCELPRSFRVDTKPTNTSTPWQEVVVSLCHAHLNPKPPLTPHQS